MARQSKSVGALRVVPGACSQNERADRPFGRSEGLAAGVLDPSRLRFLVEGFSATGDCAGRCGLQWQLLGDGQGTCAWHTAKSFQRFLCGTPINLAGPNLEYSFGPAKACRKEWFVRRKGGFSEVAEEAQEDFKESTRMLLQRLERGAIRPGASRK